MIKKPLFWSAVLVFSLLLGSCEENEPVPVAAFSFTGSNNFKAPCTVFIVNESENAFSYEWIFSDSDSVFTDTNPVHTFLKAGNYDIRLRAYTQSRNEWASKSQTVKVD